MRKFLLIILILLVFGVILLSFKFLASGNEDIWIKDSRGVWIKHGNPSTTPDEVLQQQNAITKAIELYNQKKSQGIQFSSQCLGTVNGSHGEIDGYAVDIVHVPRTSEDNLAENQCDDYRTGKVSHFIELDKDGNVVRVA